MIYLFTLFLCGCDIQDSTSASLPHTIKPNSYSQIQQVFDQFDYSWTTLDRGVPDITVHNFPADLSTVPNVKQKKHLFFLSLLPMVLTQNEKVMQQRGQLQQLLAQYDKEQTLSARDNDWINRLMKEYRFSHDPLNNSAHRQQLLSRVDMIPTALVLAQAANESAYGTSRFAQLANNIFGEWTFTPGTGIVPKGRPAGETYEVKKFSSLNDSIQSYINNLNSHQAYSKLRAAREMMRSNQQPLQAFYLAEGLLNYSTRRDAYVDEIQTMINYNQLSQLAQLERRKKSTFVANAFVRMPAKKISSNHRSIHDYL
ncbi:MAG: glucosaminidase domain-containing protein [Deltaproteobacteria bacterium]|nr:glucosaminidase domain-containing protein [Deltaproteobacteria bacterium]